MVHRYRLQRSTARLRQVLEEYIFVLKKRILQFEANTAVKGVLDDHGSM